MEMLFRSRTAIVKSAFSVRFYAVFPAKKGETEPDDTEPSREMHCLVLKYWGLRDGSLRFGGDLFSWVELQQSIYVFLGDIKSLFL
ncbi:hypothetical protein Bca4012_032011 [Brassica carinata]|uniref:(rape) hypothetical protein n=1 Tax=Brassica napus TaxID=3708 RepID=A0A816JZP9_BRANA|nr:unnamed protein product [Brassica napus]